MTPSPLSIQQFSDQLALIRACEESRKWLLDFATIEEAYAACHDARWLMWFANHTVGDTVGEKKRANALHDLILSMISQIDSLDIDRDKSGDSIRFDIEQTAKWVVEPKSYGSTNDLSMALVGEYHYWRIKNSECSTLAIYASLLNIIRDDCYSDIHEIVHKIYAVHFGGPCLLASHSVIPLAVDQSSGLSSIVKKHFSIDDYLYRYRRTLELL